MENGDFTLDYQEQLEHGMALIYSHFNQSRLEVHIGGEEKVPKTEWFFFPPPEFLGSNCIGADTENEQQTIAIRIKIKSYNNICKREEYEYNNLTMTNPIKAANDFSPSVHTLNT